MELTDLLARIKAHSGRYLVLRLWCGGRNWDETPGPSR